MAYFSFIQFRLRHVCVSINAIPYHLFPSYTLEEKEDSFMNLQVMKSYQIINQLVESAVSNDLGHKSILQIITHLMLYVVR